MTDIDPVPTGKDNSVPSSPTAPVKPGWQTSEFRLKVLAFVLTALYASGVIPTSGTVATLMAIGATMLGALGYTVSRTLVKTAAAVLLFCAFASTVTACGVPATAGHAVVDCTKADKAALEAEAIKLLAAPSWSAFEAMVIADLETVGGCAMLDTIGKYHPPTTVAAAAPMQPVDTHALVERVRSHFGGVTWMTAQGPQ